MWAFCLFEMFGNCIGTNHKLDLYLTFVKIGTIVKIEVTLLAGILF
jgi:hypothetical protein